MKEYGFELVSDSHAYVYHNPDWFGQDVELHISGKGGLLGSVVMKVDGVGSIHLGHGVAAAKFWTMLWEEMCDV